MLQGTGEGDKPVAIEVPLLPPRSRSPSPIPLSTRSIIDDAIHQPLSGLLRRPVALPAISLPHNCEKEQLLGQIGNYPPEECYESDDNEDDNTINRVTDDYDNFTRRDNVYPSSGYANWGLHFDSNFESGNLATADSVVRSFTSYSCEEYDLHLHTDNFEASDDHRTLWFFFKVQNTKTNRTYRFNICNFSRMNSPYEHGMRPIAFSDKLYADKGIGWHRIGKDCSYYRRKHVRVKLHDDKGYSYRGQYALTFTTEFQYSKDSVYIAFAQPYTYTHQQQFLSKICREVVEGCTLPTNCKFLHKKRNEWPNSAPSA